MDASGNVQGLKAALTEIGVLRVADYQRDYSWGINEINDLWADVLELLQEEGADHFLGTLILQRDSEDEKSKKYELVDGQQRLTTIFIFLAALLDQANLHETRNIAQGPRQFNVSQAIENFLLGEPGEQPDSTSSDARLVPLVFVQQIFRKITDISMTRTSRLSAVPKTAAKGDKGAPITLPLRRAYNHIDSLIVGYLGDYKPGSDTHLKQVDRIRRVFMDQFKVLKLVTDDLPDSLDVFLTLNNRGAPLGVFDLFRGEILKVRLATLEAHQRDELFLNSIEDWKSLMENLGTYSSDKYLRHFALTRNFDDKNEPRPLTMKALPKWTSEYLKSQGSSSRAAEALWEAACTSSGDYGYMLKPSSGQFADYYLEALKLIGDSYRILLLGVDFNNDDIWSKSQKERLLFLTFKLFLKWPLANRNAQVLEGKFQALVGEFKASGSTKELLKSLADQASFHLDIESRLQEEIDQSLAKAIMLVIEGTLTRSAVKLDLQDLQLEHIAPQTATSEWQEALQADNYPQTIGRLGNLVLLDNKLNSKVKQWNFEKKSDEYRKSRLMTVKDLLHLKKWTLEEIDQRSNWAAFTIGAILDEEQEPVNFTEWSQ